GLVVGAGDAAPVRVADELPAPEVDAREGDLVLEHRVRLADGAGAIVEVLERDVPFGGAVHLDDAVDAEALLERRPDVRPEARAGGDPELVIAVVRRGRRAEQVAAELADVDERDRLVAADVVEERGRAERAP